MDNHDLIAQKQHLPVPDGFTEIHPDLQGFSKNPISGIFVVLVFLFGIPFYLVSSAGIFSAQFPFIIFLLPIVFFAFALIEGRKVNAHKGRYATYIVKSEAPQEVEVVAKSRFISAATHTYKPLYYYVFDISGLHPQTARAYVVTSNGQAQSHLSNFQIQGRSPVKMKVWFDPQSHQAIMLEDDAGFRYWLEPMASLFPTG